MPVKRAKIKITSENKCSFCKGVKCCHYVTQNFDAPRSKYDFEHMLWQVSHKDVEIYKDDGAWYLMFITQCEHLQDNGGCGIYDKRPQLCRDYSNDWCEYDEPADKHWQLYFPDYKSLHKYCKKRFKRWDR